MIEEFYGLIPKALKSESGAVFNAGRSAFSKPSALYLLGLNPGGDPALHQEETLDSHTKKVLSKENDWSAFQDESWDGRAVGTKGMQPRIVHLLQKVGVAPRDVPASNVVFRRTSNEKGLNGQFARLAEQCWPFHAAVIEKLQIRVVLCCGGTAGKWVCDKLGAQEPAGRFVETNNRRWASPAFRNSKTGIAVMIAAHPARANWINPASDPSALLKTLLEERL